MSADDRFVAVGGRTFPFRQSVVIVGASRHAAGLLSYGPGGRLEVAWHKEGAVESIDGSGDSWDFRGEDRILAAQLGGDPDPEVVVMNPALRLGAVIGVEGNSSLAVRWLAPGTVPMPAAKGTQGWLIDANSRYLAGDLDRDGIEEVVVVSLDQRGSRIGVLRGIPGTMPRTGAALPSRFGPDGVAVLDIASGYSRTEATQRRDGIAAAYRANSDIDAQGVVTYRPQHMPYLDEAYYFVPMELALRLGESGYYTDALDWLRSVYDYDRRPDDRKIAYKLIIDAGEPTFDRAQDWLLDPLTPDAIAETRRNSFTKFTIFSIVRTLLDFADREFTRATPESVPRARRLYLAALDLLDSPEMAEGSVACRDLIGTLNLHIGEDETIWIRKDIADLLHTIRNAGTLSGLVEKLPPLLAPGDGAAARLRQAREMAADAVRAERASPVPTFAAVLEQQKTAAGAASLALLADDSTATRLARAGTAAHDLAFARRPGIYQYIPAPSLVFCILPNPAFQMARRHAELSLYKIRTCKNIAGLDMHLEPYAAPAAADAAFASFNDGDQLPAMPPQNFQPLPYRYAVLIERTKQLVELARQMESSMLSFLASADQEKYQEVKARQDLALTQAALRLKDVQLLQADDGITAAQLQRDRAQLQADTYRERIAAGLSVMEDLALGAQHAAVAHLHTAAAITEASTFGIGGIGEVGQALAATSQVFQMQASFERREQDWRTDMELAGQDVRIGQQQIRLAQDQARVVGQERAIAELQVNQAAGILDFLTTKKLTGYDLYEWMSGVVEQVYRFFLLQATSMAQLAERQLAFERQEIVSTFIQSDYWEPPAQGQTPDFSPPVNGLAVDLHGLTGSARLLRDVYQLDQYAFLKNQRKLQLTETISLSLLDPFAFEQFRQSGVMVFSTPMRLFDLKFPGHYLRLVKRVRTSVIALIPPTQGIRATLATTGTSRVVIGNDLFDTVTIQRGPEAVSLSSPINATGVFDLDPQPELMVTFEGMGVDATWELRLPKASNPFDYQTLADVLVTIDYTALDSSDYRQRVIADLDRSVSFDRAFSVRQQFPDAWYDLHNPDQATPPEMTVHFRTERDDFPPNLEDLRIQQVALYVPRGGEQPFGTSFATTLQFREQDGGAAVGGLADTTDTARSTRRGNASSWLPMIGKSPVGEWTLALADTTQTRSYFDNDEIEDILLVITYGGRTPPWPQ
jgi:hypothetical protein